MRNYILTHAVPVQTILSCISAILIVILLYIYVPIITGYFSLLREWISTLVKFRKGSQSETAQRRLIADQVKCIKHLVSKTLENSELSDEMQDELHRILQSSHIIYQDALCSTLNLDSCLDELDNLMDELEAIVPESLHHLNPYFLKNFPSHMTSKEWTKRIIRLDWIAPVMCLVLSLLGLIKSVLMPSIIKLSFLPLVISALWILIKHFSLFRKSEDVNEELSRLYDKTYTHMLVTITLNILLYVGLRFILFSL